MTESLGRALLELSTIDRGLFSGIKNAKSAARDLDRDFDDIKDSFGKFGLLGESAGRQGAVGLQLTTAELTNMQFQINDIATGLISGQSPFTVMAQQGLQIAQIFGAKGSTSVGAALRATGTALSSFLLNPLTLAVLGFGAAATAAQALFSFIASSGRGANSTLEQHETLIERVKAAYGDAAKNVRAFGEESREVLELLLRADFDRLQARVQDLTRSLTDALTNELSTFSQRVVDTGAFQTFEQVPEIQAAIESLVASLRSGSPQVERFVREIAAISNAAADDTELRAITAKIIELADEANEAARALRGTKEALDALGGDITVAGEFDALPSEFERQRDAILEEIRRRDEAARKAGRERESAARAPQREREGVEKLIADLEFEKSLIGLSNVERATQIALREAGAAATELERQQIRALVPEIVAADEATKGLTETSEAFRSAFEAGFNDLISGAKSFKDAIKNMATSILQDLSRIASSRLFDGLFGATGGGSGGGLFSGLISGLTSLLGFADGAAFSGGRLVPFAAGGVVARPTLFPFAGGVGLMGEAGEEAIMPLARGRDGRLGVRAQGGGGTQINFAPVINSSLGAVDRAWVLGQLERAKRDMVELVDKRQRAQLQSRSDAFVRPA